MEFWRAVFKPKMDDVAQLDTFLTKKLQEPCRYHIAHAGRVLVEGPTRDDLFKTSEWIRHQNPIGLIPYSVIGYEGQKIIFVDSCPKCRSKDVNTPHHEHE